MITKCTRSLGVLATVLLVGVCADSAEAATPNRVVGTCTPNPLVTIKSRHTTIQDAVDASFMAAQPANILVCPGTYREQVEIAPIMASIQAKVAAGTIPAEDVPDYAPIITMKGINLTVGPAIIAPPAAGLHSNFTSATFGPIAAQLLVHDTAGATISNLEIDGTGGGCPRIGGVAVRPAGVMFARAGDYENYAYSTTAGTVKFMSIHDQQYPWTASCGADAFGVISEDSYIKINDNVITKINDIGIYELGGNNQILRNNLTFCGGYGIVLYGASQSDVSLNTLSAINLSGIVLQGGTNLATVELNVFTPALPVGVYIDGGFDNSVTHNKGSFSFAGVFLDNGSSGNVVEDNQIDHCAFACIANRWSHGNNTIDWNDIDTSAAFGIWLRHIDNEYLTDNVYSNVFTGTIPVPICHSSTDSFDPNAPCLPPTP